MSSEWDFYLSQIDNKAASFFLDMGIAQQAPISGLDKVGHIRIWMRQPRIDGLSSQEEYDALIVLEDVLTEEIGRNDSSAYVGRSTSAGCRDFYFYIQDEAAFKASASNALSQFATYRSAVSTWRDEAWSVYFSILYPNEEQRRLIADRAVIESLRKHGDDGLLPRKIDHLIIVQTREQATSLAGLIAARGFALDVGTPSGKSTSEWWVQFSKVEAPKDIGETTKILDWIAKENGADYDGWGCVVVATESKQ